LIALTAKYSGVKLAMKNLRKFYGDTAEENGEEDLAQLFLKTLTDFASHYKKANDDLVNWQEEVRCLALLLFIIIILREKKKLC
jgi:hypothetical protein